ncbi:MAG: DNA polymerase IV [Ruminococcaceae bacterium]|nr:DNA polymerase IV [Oscillospiraceae bacterium]
MERLIFHVDVNSAFLSWEAVRHLAHTGEDLRLIPSAIGGDPQKRTGIILAKSIPAKKMGVVTGEPISMALRKCPGLVLAKPDFHLYQQNSHAFTDICRQYAPVVEKFSIDECFLDMTGTGLLYPDPVKIAHEIKDRIREALGFTVNIGIGENKLLAKMASDFEKPDRVHTLFKREIPEKLWPLPVGDLFLTGKATVEKLQKINIYTVGELAKMELTSLQGLLGQKHGASLYARARGEDDSPVLAEPEEAKGYSISTTLEEDVTEAVEANRILLALADSVATRMRADGAQTACIAVTIRANDFKNHSHQLTLSDPTDGTMEIYTHACRLFAALWDKNTPLRLLGISLTQLSKKDDGQMTFFTNPKREREEKLDKTVDGIRARFGSGAVVRGAVYKTPIDVGRKYKARLENKE